MSDFSSLIQEAKNRLRIPELWRILKPGEKPPKKGVCRSPFRPDKHPSFSIFDHDRKWKDHATGDGGDAVDFIMHAERLSNSDAIKRFMLLAGLTAPSPRSHANDHAESENQAFFPRARAIACAGARGAREEGGPEGQFPINPFTHAPLSAHGESAENKNPDVSALHRPSDSEIESIARLRCLHPDALARAANWCILRTGVIYGNHCWAVVDGPPGEPKRIAEIRRMDGQKIVTRENPEGAKGITLRHSKKDWPVGASLLAHPRAASHGVLLVEGMPDFLAAVHFAWEADRFDLYPVAILGRSNQTLHPAAIALLKGRRIRAYPHADADGGGMAAMERWAFQLPSASVDAFTFTGLRRRDGKPVNDLNDCAVIHPDDREHLQELLPDRPQREASQS